MKGEKEEPGFLGQKGATRDPGGLGPQGEPGF